MRNIGFQKTAYKTGCDNLAKGFYATRSVWTLDNNDNNNNEIIMKSVNMYGSYRKIKIGFPLFGTVYSVHRRLYIGLKILVLE